MKHIILKIEKAALEKQKKEMSKLETRKRKLRLICDKHLRNQLVEVEIAVKIGMCTDFNPWTTEQELLEQALKHTNQQVHLKTGKDKEGLPETIGNVSRWLEQRKLLKSKD
ncbi:hypothetical protein QTO34_017674 [Cnephaeus nilssonii]|uniref:Uncharacterized protein n=1 Tax=Cnephaeus nilssonii TaxID=3371016 RepID=A0AA40I2C9_CNENI|nr:hypothetical protein QTO34_017674 [Eptesicus nilssonii]